MEHDLDSFLNDENTYSDFEKHIYDGYMQNSVVFPHILNLSFLFDDYPATPTTSREWSLNRYMGFYLDSFDLVKSVNAYTLTKLNNDLKITNGNIIISSSNFNPFIDLYENIEYPNSAKTHCNLLDPENYEIPCTSNPNPNHHKP